MKKTICLVLAIAMICGVLFAAGSKEQAPAAADALKIAIVTSPSGVDDGSFNEDNYNGILAFIKKHPAAKVTPLREPTGDSAAAVKAASDIVADYDVEVCTGFQFAGIGNLAKENPKTKFILVDSFPSDANGKEVALNNVYAMNSIIVDGMAFSLPLFIIAIGGIFSEGSGITNLALEGFLGFGAFCGGLSVALFGSGMG